MSVYAITPADLASITDPERAFGAIRLLPAWECIPEGFKQGNVYTELAEAIFYGRPMPDVVIVFEAGFEESAKAVNDCVRAHLQSFQPKHEHKIAGVGYMISKVMTLRPSPNNLK